MRVLIVGAGAAGASAALRARELGAEVTLLEAEEVGGVSLNRGPAPVRTLARAARLARDWSSWEQFGLEGPRPTPNLRTALANGERVSRYARDRKHMADHLRAHGIDLVEHTGPVEFADPHTVRARDGRTWPGDRVILAVGGRASGLPVPGADLALTYEDLLSLKTLPTSAAVIGGADTGCQIASILADFGVRVVIIEAGPALLAHADPEVSAGMKKAFRDRGMVVHTGALAQSLESDGGWTTINYRTLDDTNTTSEDTVSVDVVFAAIGWPANIEALGLERAGVAVGPRGVAVDEYLRTNVEHIFAAGDVNGHLKLVQTARAEGRAAAENAVSGPVRRVAHDTVPSGSFTDPEYGQVGLTEPEAAARCDAFGVVANYEDLLRPVTDGRPDGFCKLVVDRESHKVLGAHVLGEYSAEIVQVAATAMAAGMTVEEIAGLSYAFPTFTEAVGMAAQKACRELGLGAFPAVWSELASTS
ncbi:MAG TPA: NAD(P)/FAD-dependent oxidoreductase [Actinocrinis sp.]|nr:NAD(P)/FAD-dependent oxidoreductase [Actinocrinis sp.]